MSCCTAFCERLKAVKGGDGALPRHDELVAQLGFSADDRERGRLLGTWHELQQRAQCGFCELVVAAIAAHDADSKHGHGGTPPTQPVRVLLFPGEQAFRLSYPSPLGLLLAFVAEHAEQVTGPDTARRVDQPYIEISRVQAWLKACDEKHEACLPRPVKEPSVGSSDKKRWSRKFNESSTSNFRVLVSLAH